MGALMTKTEHDKLKDALQRNAEHDHALLMGEDTSFVGTSTELPTDDEVISAIRSVPCHY